MSHAVSLHSLRASSLRERRVSIDAFCSSWREQTALLVALPQRYTDVLQDLLSRFEAGRLFTEESCSLGQNDLLATLDMGLDKAELTLTKTD